MYNVSQLSVKYWRMVIVEPSCYPDIYKHRDTALLNTKSNLNKLSQLFLNLQPILKQV